MAQDSDVSKSVDKGKGKAVDGDKVDDAKKAKDGQAQVNGKKDDEKIVDCKAPSASMHPGPCPSPNLLSR